MDKGTADSHGSEPCDKERMKPSVEELLPEGQARRHEQDFRHAVEEVIGAIHAYVFDYPSVARHRARIEEILGNAQSHLYPHVDRPKLVINLADHASIEILMPKSEGGALRTIGFFEKARDRMLEKSVPIPQWADYCQEGSAIFNLALLAHHLDRRNENEKEGLFLADRLAILCLAGHSEANLEGISFEEIIAHAEGRLSEQSNPWSRSALTHLNVGRSNRLLHMDRQNAPRDDAIEIKGDFPEAIIQRFRAIKNSPLEELISMPGLASARLLARKVDVAGNGWDHVIRTDSWSRKKLHVLKTKPRKKRP